MALLRELKLRVFSRSNARPSSTQLPQTTVIGFKTAAPQVDAPSQQRRRKDPDAPCRVCMSMFSTPGRFRKSATERSCSLAALKSSSAQCCCCRCIYRALERQYLNATQWAECLSIQDNLNLKVDEDFGPKVLVVSLSMADGTYLRCRLQMGTATGLSC